MKNETGRQEGYYWVKLDDPISPQWQSALWCDNDGGFDGGDWWWRLTGDDDKYFDEDFTEINETPIPSPDANIVGLQASVKGLLMSEFEAYQLLKKQFESPPETVKDGEYTFNFFQSKEHCDNYRSDAIKSYNSPAPTDGYARSIFHAARMKTKTVEHTTQSTQTPAVVLNPADPRQQAATAIIEAYINQKNDQRERGYERAAELTLSSIELPEITEEHANRLKHVLSVAMENSTMDPFVMAITSFIGKRVYYSNKPISSQKYKLEGTLMMDRSNDYLYTKM